MTGPLNSLLAALNEPDPQIHLVPAGFLLTPCHRCGQPATQQWQQHATDTEREAHWAALEQSIRASNDGRPETTYTADRTQPVTKSVHGCDQHVVDAPHLTHEAECGGHGACGCQPEATHGNGPQ